MGWMFDNVGRLIARLQAPATRRAPLNPDDSTDLSDILRPGDVLLVEGKSHISGCIKYLTQSNWSHSALYVGPIADAGTEDDPHVFIEANIDEGVVSAPLSKYLHCQTRICRPVGLCETDCEQVCRYARERIGLGYDFKNIVDLMRYLFPWPMTHSASQDDRARFGRCEPHHLFLADRASLRHRTLPDPAPHHARRGARGAAGNCRDPPSLALCTTRLRYFPLFHGRKAHAGARLQL